ncbi:hypothetical protein TNCV_1981881 [Trichonephila clavipes]|nr:hypothetical protein TNCV_1981881 [Trichonephila clavipes]
MGTTNHHRWGRRPHLVGENRDNSRRRKDDAPGELVAKRMREYSYTTRTPQCHKIPCFPTARPPGIAARSIEDQSSLVGVV